MHELSIVASIVDTVTESLAVYQGARVTEVHLRVGALAAVVEDSLQFCYGMLLRNAAGGLEVVGQDTAGGDALRCLRRRWGD